MFPSKQKYLIISCIGFIGLLSWIVNTPNNPLTNLNVDEIIKSFGYPSEVHEVTTEDGYILTLNRIPYSRNNTSNSSFPRIPVLLMHGMMQSAADYVLAGNENALALLLADKGFDVWMGNTRGCRWSRKHKSFDPDTQREYWNITGHEVSVYDTSANIDYILNITNQSRLHYVGFSQGTSEIFITVSERPEYNKKLRLVSTLSPVVFLEGVSNFFVHMASYHVDVVQDLLRITKIDEVMTPNGFVASFQRFICNGNSFLIYFCALHFKVMEATNTHVDKDSLSSLTSHTPAGMGTKHFIHCLQILRIGKLQKFDYGKEVNLELYGQETPYEYNISKLTAPLAIYYSKSDTMVHWKNIAKLESHCSNVIRSYEIPVDDFRHLDFLLAKNVAKILYNTIVEEMMKY